MLTTNDLKDGRADCVLFVSDFGGVSGIEVLDKAYSAATALDKAAAVQTSLVRGFSPSASAHFGHH